MDDAASLRDGKAHESMQPRGSGLAIDGGIRRVGDHVQILVGIGLFASAAAQEIERRIVGDAKQPAFRVGNRAGNGQGLDRLGQRLLQHILAIEDRAGHAGTVAVQLGAQFPKQALKEPMLPARNGNVHEPPFCDLIFLDHAFSIR
ncbi:hypothetical protein MesoLj131c_34950 [Mesorhizobium sp. 131-3-5]|nr:hypothetical protein MesoLj131c_34950 [Mesorhizobium sp. 131-3-5]